MICPQEKSFRMENDEKCWITPKGLLKDMLSQWLNIYRPIFLWIPKKSKLVKFDHSAHNNASS
jgi:hypothetical protein